MYLSRNTILPIKNCNMNFKHMLKNFFTTIKNFVSQKTKSKKKITKYIINDYKYIYDVAFKNNGKTVIVWNYTNYNVDIMDLETFISTFQKEYILCRREYILINKEQILLYINKFPSKSFRCYMKKRNETTHIKDKITIEELYNTEEYLIFDYN